MEAHFAGRNAFDINRVPGSGLIEYLTPIEYLATFPMGYFSDKNANSGFIFSLNNNNNILQQSGAFVWNSSSYKPLEVVGTELYFENNPDAKPNEYRFCECYNINKNLAGYIRECLQADGVSHDSMYAATNLDASHIYQNCIRFQ